jgi:hypothetical protein
MKAHLALLALLSNAAFAQTINCQPDAAPDVKLAAKEIRRYVFLRRFLGSRTMAH